MTEDEDKQVETAISQLEVAIVILAAGAARRFGRPKQLERWPAPDGPTLVERAVALARQAQVGPVYVVTGNHGERIEKLLNRHSDVVAVYNPHWEEGQGSSVTAGVKEVQVRQPEAGGILFMLADQPRLQLETLKALVERFQQIEPSREQAIVFPVYQNKRGNPVLFGRAFFDRLARLEGDSGGRQVVKAHPDAVIEVVVNDAAVHEDVDTPADLEALNNQQI